MKKNHSLLKVVIRNCIKGDNSAIKRKGILIMREIGTRYRSDSQSSKADFFFVKPGQHK